VHIAYLAITAGQSPALLIDQAQRYLAVSAGRALQLHLQSQCDGFVGRRLVLHRGPQNAQGADTHVQLALAQGRRLFVQVIDKDRIACQVVRFYQCAALLQKVGQQAAAIRLALVPLDEGRPSAIDMPRVDLLQGGLNRVFDLCRGPAGVHVDILKRDALQIVSQGPIVVIHPHRASRR